MAVAAAIVEVSRFAGTAGARPDSFASVDQFGKGPVGRVPVGTSLGAVEQG